MPELRVLGSVARPMQRLGYLKRLARRVTAVSTTSLENLGLDLVNTIARKVSVPLTEERATYIKQRLYDRAYTTLKLQADDWLKNGQEGAPPQVSMEIQDLYLADSTLPSQTGKLVRKDWRKYPPLAVHLGLIRAGTYSASTRTLSLLHFTPVEELKAFLEYNSEVNPLRLNRKQSLFLLYALIENDGEVLSALWRRLSTGDSETFTDRDAGDLLPDIYRSIISRHRSRILSAEDRDRLAVLAESADSIARWHNAAYTGGGAREEASRPRVEPYVDCDILYKPNPFRYEYAFSPGGFVWAYTFADAETSEEIADFLGTRFFTTAAQAWSIAANPLIDNSEIVSHLYRAWLAIRSPGGYAPIKELSLVAGIDALLDHDIIIEPFVAREAIIAYQKANPYQVRFTVNRMGVLAHARFLEAPIDNVTG